MTMLLNLACFLIALAGMEAVAWASHRWIMHGPLWVLHRSHHEPRRGAFEVNDLFAVMFAIPAIAMFWIGTDRGWSWLVWAAAGVTAYGVLYAIVHDGLVHQRWPFRIVPRQGYLRRLVQAHRLHHAVHEKERAVSFGFLAPQDVRRLAQELKLRRAHGLDAGPQAGAGRHGEEPLEPAP
jgi:beta-carotene 3-hydroxylase